MRGLLTTLLALILAATASSQVDLTSTTSVGTDKLSVSVKGLSKLSLVSTTATFAIAPSDTFNYTDGFVSITGAIDDSSKKPTISIGNIQAVQIQLASLIGAENPAFAPVTVVIDLTKLKVKLSAKAKERIELKFDLSIQFTANGVKGKAKLQAKLRGPATFENRTYGGVEKYKASIKGFPGVSFNSDVISLAFGPFAGDMVPFTYTNFSDPEVFTGDIDLSGKKLVVTLDAASLVALEDSLEALILSVSGFSSTVTVDQASIKSSLKIGKGATSVQISFSAKFTANVAGSLLGGKMSVKAKLVQA